jgi:acetyl-CoA acyltransferase
MTREAVIVAGLRTAVGKARRGTTQNWRSDEMAAEVIKALLARLEGLDPALIDDVVIGCAMPESAQGLNFARSIALRAGLPVDVPGMTVNRFCSSGLQTIAMSAERIIADGADIIIAGGAETMSLVPMTGYRLSPNPWLVDNEPEVYMNMGLTAECVAEEYEVTRQAQDEFALRSHQRAAAAQAAGRFQAEIVPLEIEEVVPARGGPARQTAVFDKDEHLRADTSLEGLAKLKPVFKQGGTVTAGNSSPLSDGAAAVVIMERQTAERLGFKPLARFVGFNVGGVRPEVMGVGPIVAVPRLLRRTGLRLDDIGLIELNEAFAAQGLAVLRQLGVADDAEHVNPHGGAIALGHPLGMSGARLTLTAVHGLEKRSGKRALATMCVGVGQGVSLAVERI